MKKVILALGVVTVMASCGGSSETKEVSTDSTTVVVDSTKTVDSTLVDTTRVTEVK